MYLLELWLQFCTVLAFAKSTLWGCLICTILQSISNDRFGRKRSTYDIQRAIKVQSQFIGRNIICLYSFVSKRTYIIVDIHVHECMAQIIYYIAKSC